MDCNCVSFMEKYPHTRMMVNSIEKADLTDGDLSVMLTGYHKIRFKEKYLMVSINGGALKGFMHKNIIGIIEDGHLQDIWYTFRDDHTTEIIMAIRRDIPDNIKEL